MPEAATPTNEGIERRELIKLSLRSFLALTTALPILAQNARHIGGQDASGLDWDRFLEGVENVARSQHQPDWDEMRYVHQIESLAQGLRLTDPDLTRILDSAIGRHETQPSFRDLLNVRKSFQVTLITFERGQGLALHDHPRMTGVMTCALGTIDVRSFQMLGGTEQRLFTLRDEGLIRMHPGDVGALTSHSKNIHGLKAQSFAQVIDIFTPPYDPARVQESRFFQIVSSRGELGTVTARLLNRR